MCGLHRGSRVRGVVGDLYEGGGVWRGRGRCHKLVEAVASRRLERGRGHGSSGAGGEVRGRAELVVGTAGVGELRGRRGRQLQSGRGGGWRRRVRSRSRCKAGGTYGTEISPTLDAARHGTEIATLEGAHVVSALQGTKIAAWHGTVIPTRKGTEIAATSHRHGTGIIPPQHHGLLLLQSPSHFRHGC